jgi:hypothetical protein
MLASNKVRLLFATQATLKTLPLFMPLFMPLSPVVTRPLRELVAAEVTQMLAKEQTH